MAEENTSYHSGIEQNKFTASTLTAAKAALTSYAKKHSSWLSSYASDSSAYVVLVYESSSQYKAGMYYYDASTKTWNEITSIVGVVGSDANELVIEYSSDGEDDWLTSPSSSTYYMRVSTDGGETYTKGFLYRGSDGSDGVTPIAQYSTDDENWHSTAVGDDTYIRWSTDNGDTWTDGILMVGSDAYDTIFQFSEDGETNWHSAVTDDDIYWRWSHDNGNSWTADGVAFRGVASNTIDIQYSVDGSTDWHTPATDDDYYWRWSTDGGETWSSAAPFRSTDGSGIGIPEPYGFTIGDDGELIITLDGEAVAYISDLGSWFAEALTTGVGSFHLGDLHSIGSAGRNVIFQNNINLRAFDPPWGYLSQDGQTVQNPQVRIYGEALTYEPDGELTADTSGAEMSFDVVIGSNRVTYQMDFYPDSDFTGNLIFTTKDTDGNEVHKFTYEDVSLTAGEVYNLVFKYPIWSYSDDEYLVTLVGEDDDGNGFTFMTVSDTTTAYRKMYYREFSEYELCHLGDGASIATLLNALTGDDRLDANALQNLTLNDAATTSTSGIVTLSSVVPAESTEAGTHGTQNGVVANADHGHPFGLQPVTHGGTGLEEVAITSLLYASAENVISAFTPTTGTVGVWVFNGSEWEARSMSGTGNIVGATSPTLTTPTIGNIKFTSATGSAGKTLMLASDGQTVIYSTPDANATFIRGVQIVIDSLADGEILQYDSANSRWTNKDLADTVAASSVGGLSLSFPNSPVANSYLYFDGTNITLTEVALADASKVQGVEVDDADIADQSLLTYDADNTKLIYQALSDFTSFSNLSDRVTAIEDDVYGHWYRTSTILLADGAANDTTKTELNFPGIPGSDFTGYVYNPSTGLTLGLRFGFTDSVNYYIGTIFVVSANDAESATPVNADTKSALTLADAAGDFDMYEGIQTYVRCNGEVYFIPEVTNSDGTINGDYPAYIVQFNIVRSGDSSSADDRFDIYSRTIKLDSDWSNFTQVSYS